MDMEYVDFGEAQSGGAYFPRMGKGWKIALSIFAILVVVAIVSSVVLVVLIQPLGGISLDKVENKEGLAMLPANYPYWRRPYYPYYNSLPFWWRIRYGYYPYRRMFSTPMYYRGRPLMWWN